MESVPSRGKGTDTPTSESSQQAPATQADAPGQEIPEPPVDGPDQEPDRTEGQGQ